MCEEYKKRLAFNDTTIFPWEKMANFGLWEGCIYQQKVICGNYC